MQVPMGQLAGLAEVELAWGEGELRLVPGPESHLDNL